MHTVFALLCFVVVIHWLIFPYPSGLLHWHCGNLTISPVPAKQPWWIWIYTSCEFIMNDWITTTKQSTTKPCAYFLGYTVLSLLYLDIWHCNRGWPNLNCDFLHLSLTGLTVTRSPDTIASRNINGIWLSQYSPASVYECTRRSVAGGFSYGFCSCEITHNIYMRIISIQSTRHLIVAILLGKSLRPITGSLTRA